MTTSEAEHYDPLMNEIYSGPRRRARRAVVNGGVQTGAVTGAGWAAEHAFIGGLFTGPWAAGYATGQATGYVADEAIRTVTNKRLNVPRFADVARTRPAERFLKYGVIALQAVVTLGLVGLMQDGLSAGAAGNVATMAGLFTVGMALLGELREKIERRRHGLSRRRPAYRALEAMSKTRCWAAEAVRLHRDDAGDDQVAFALKQMRGHAEQADRAELIGPLDALLHAKMAPPEVLFDGGIEDLVRRAKQLSHASLLIEQHDDNAVRWAFHRDLDELLAPVSALIGEINRVAERAHKQEVDNGTRPKDTMPKTADDYLGKGFVANIDRRRKQAGNAPGREDRSRWVPASMTGPAPM